MSCIEGVSAQKGIAVAGDPVHAQPTAVVEEVADKVDGDDLAERRPSVGKMPYIPIKAEVEEHNPLP